jgi:hypothetical protein
LAIIDRHYGHPARDGFDHAVVLLDAYARDSAGRTPDGRRHGPGKNALGATVRTPVDSTMFGAVDVSWTPSLRNVFSPGNKTVTEQKLPEAL